MPSIQTALSIFLIAFLAALVPLLSKLYAFFPIQQSILFCVASPSTLSITTLNPSQPHATCFRVRDGIFVSVEGKFPTSGADNRNIVFLPGHVLPGLIDSHGHVLQYGEMLESVQLQGAENMAEVRRRIKEFLKTDQGAWTGTRTRWIRGIGWDQGAWGGAMPMAEELSSDPALAGLYIMLYRIDVHCVLVSQPVLDLLPNPLPPSPPGGEVILTPGPGVFCDNAMDALILPLAPIPSDTTKTRWFHAASAALSRDGITAVSDAGLRSHDISLLASLMQSQPPFQSSIFLDPNPRITIRISAMLECTARNTFCPSVLASLPIKGGDIPLAGTSTSQLVFGGVKLFADGALGSWGAAMLEPYSDREGNNTGSMLLSAAELKDIVQLWCSAGVRVNIHAIGDEANRAAINAFKAVLAHPEEHKSNNPNSARRLRIEHAQIIHPLDQARLLKLGILPSIQPTHATSDMTYALSRLGEQRLQDRAYRMRSLFPSSDTDAAARIEDDKNLAGVTPEGYPGPLLGSDFPVEPPNPFRGMYAAVTRLNPAILPAPQLEGWYKKEALTPMQALLGFTRNAAYGWEREDVMGAIEAGKWADFVVVDRDVLANGEGKDLRDVVVVQTWVGGRKVFDLVEDGIVEERQGKKKGGRGERELKDEL